MVRVCSASALLVALPLIGGCGSSSPSGPSASGNSTITIVGQNGAQAFSPNPSTFAGQSVVFRNNDTITHRVVLNDGTVDTGDIPPGGTSRAVTMPPAGTNYHCTVHPGMIGSVGGSSQPPPPCTGDYCTGY